MLHYLKIFSWFLFTFGVVGLAAVIFGLDLGIGPRTTAVGIMALQVAVASLILAGFRLHNAGTLSRNALVYGGWILIAILVVLGQILINAAKS